MPDNVSHGRKRRRDELCHSVLLAQGLDHTDARVRKAMMSGKAESVAKLINSQSRAHRRDVCTLLDMLPSEPLSWQSDSGGKSFQVGSFVHKDVCGVRSMTRQFPETSKALCAYVKALFPGLEFGAAIAALSDFEQGALWMEDPAGEEFQEVGGRRVAGVCIPVLAEGFRFDGKRLHATMPWNGRRDVIVAYMPRGRQDLKPEHAAFLKSLGFVLDSSERGKGSTLQGFTKAVIGVYRMPEQFVAEAASLGHPSQLSTLLLAEILTAVRKIHRVGEATVAKERAATLRRWMSMAVELEPTEKSLKSSLPAFRKAVLQPKGLLSSVRCSKKWGMKTLSW